MAQRSAPLGYQRRLDRGRRFWDLGARTQRRGGLAERQAGAQSRLMVHALELAPGEVVLDLGCGSGLAFTALRQAVGESGRVVGLDYSPRMLAKARALVAEHGWDNVEVRHGDASATSFEAGAYDAAVASYSLSTVPDLKAAVDRLYTALRPGGRAFIADMAFGPHSGARLLRAFYRAVMAANGDDVADALRSRFDTVGPVIDDRGRELALPPGRSWPPITYLLARKAHA